MALDGDGDGDRNLQNEHNNNLPADPDIPDSSEFIPPESFWLSKDSEFDWFDRNAFLERKESTRGNSNLKNLNPNGTYSRSNSQKFTVNLKTKPAIIGLPKTQKNTHVDSTRRHCKPTNVRLFPKRSSSGGRALAEPSSPKVSCIGRVRSKRCPNRRKSKTPAPAPAPAPEKVPEIQQRKAGFVSRITSLFRSDGARRRKNNKSMAKFSESENSYSRKNSVTVKPVNSEPSTPPEPPVIGGMNRFASGRRTVAWSEDVERAGRRLTTGNRL